MVFHKIRRCGKFGSTHSMGRRKHAVHKWLDTKSRSCGFGFTPRLPPMSGLMFENPQTRKTEHEKFAADAENYSDPPDSRQHFVNPILAPQVVENQGNWQIYYRQMAWPEIRRCGKPATRLPSAPTTLPVRCTSPLENRQLSRFQWFVLAVQLAWLWRKHS